MQFITSVLQGTLNLTKTLHQPTSYAPSARRSTQAALLTFWTSLPPPKMLMQSSASLRIKSINLRVLSCKVDGSCQVLTVSRIPICGKCRVGNCKHPTIWRNGSFLTRETSLHKLQQGTVMNVWVEFNVGAFVLTQIKSTLMDSLRSECSKLLLTVVSGTTSRLPASSSLANPSTQNSGTSDYASPASAKP